MQTPIDPDEDLFVNELKQLRPPPPLTSKADLWYTAGFNAAQKRARRLHALAIVACVGSVAFPLFRPAPGPVVQVAVARSHVQPIVQPPIQNPSLANSIENRRQLEDVLNDKWTVASVHNAASPTPPMRAFMSESDLEKAGGL